LERKRETISHIGGSSQPVEKKTNVKTDASISRSIKLKIKNK